VKNAHKLERLANDIHDVTRIENKQLKLYVERFNLIDLIADIVEESKDNNGNAITNEENSNRADSQTELVQVDYDSAAEDIIFVEADKARIARDF
jgi:signal transduction histidine kinase